MSVSNFLRSKWSRAFSMYDTNRDDYLSEEDLAGLAEFISRQTNATPEEAEITRAECVNWFSRLMPDPSIDKLDVYAHNNCLAELYLKDTKAFRKEIGHTFSHLFDIMDLNKDGNISLDELEVFYEALGVTDKRFVKEIFDTIDENGDGLIERSEFEAAQVQYWTSAEEPDKFEFMYDPSYGKDKPRLPLEN